MRNILVTGGTVFVSRAIAEFYVKKGENVYVLNRNNREQPKGVNLIEADRYKLGDILKKYKFDVVVDTAYTGEEVKCLLDGLGEFEQYILISSSAVYPETLEQPFREEQQTGPNRIWGAYGANKIEAEQEALSRVQNVYILRPPYLYGPMNNIYREAFVFDCAINERKFYVPRDGKDKLQFFLVEDMCRFMEILLETRPVQRIYNVGNEQTVTVEEWVKCCYEAAGKTAEIVPVYEDIEQREYFSFYNYEYQLDVTKQTALMKETTPLETGLRECFAWYVNHRDMVNRKPYMEYIDRRWNGGEKDDE